MFNENNVSDELYDKYLYLINNSKGRMKASKRLEIISSVLRYINDKFDKFNKDELIVINNILSISKQWIQKERNNGSAMANLIICNNHCLNLEEKINKKS